MQVCCVKHVDHYIPPLWIMCMESVVHLMVMLNFYSNFLIYCSVSKQFKQALCRVCSIVCCHSSPPCYQSESSELSFPPRHLQLSSCTLVMEMTDQPLEEAEAGQEKVDDISSKNVTNAN